MERKNAVGRSQNGSIPARGTRTDLAQQHFSANTATRNCQVGERCPRLRKQPQARRTQRIRERRFSAPDAVVAPKKSGAHQTNKTNHDTYLLRSKCNFYHFLRKKIIVFSKKVATARSAFFSSGKRAATHQAASCCRDRRKEFRQEPFLRRRKDRARRETDATAVRQKRWQSASHRQARDGRPQSSATAPKSAWHAQ